MLTRAISRALIVASIASLAAVSYSLFDDFRTRRERSRTLHRLAVIAEEEGPCAALVASHAVPPALLPALEASLTELRQQYVEEIVHESDPRAVEALRLADQQGLVDYTQCEEFRLLGDAGVTHPVLALWRYTKAAGSFCDDEPQLAAALSGLGSHRGVLLHALLRDVGQLRFLSPELGAQIAEMAVAAALDAPRLFDDLDTLRIAGFLSETTPLAAGRLGCALEARHELSLLAAQIGCTPDTKRRVLVHYRLPGEGREVLWLRERGPTCTVMPVDEVTSLDVPCAELRLASDLVVGVRIERLSYGRAEADLLAGLGTYVAAEQALVGPAKAPDVQSWFGYDREGRFVGPAHVVELRAVAAALGEQIPERPVRAFCERTGARYCYDVDWVHTVEHLTGEPVLYLSRPAAVFLAPWQGEGASDVFRQAFGRDPAGDASWRVYGLAGGGALATEAHPEGVVLRWRIGEASPWREQTLGSGEGGSPAPQARIIAVLDLRQDGLPELVAQRVSRQASPAGARDANDEILLLALRRDASHFTEVNRLTVHEY
jgi:hypothetical protein